MTCNNTIIFQILQKNPANVKQHLQDKFGLSYMITYEILLTVRFNRFIFSVGIMSMQ